MRRQSTPVVREPTGLVSTPACGRPAVYALVLALGNYRSSTDLDDFSTTTASQPDSALSAIVLGFSLLPAVLIVASLVFLSRYRLDHTAVDAAEVTA
jgi:GPH family glycoside/pentoside/hexuronide:cation symporter